jgi:hypothetical protein
VLKDVKREMEENIDLYDHNLIGVLRLDGDIYT